MLEALLESGVRFTHRLLGQFPGGDVHEREQENPPMVVDQIETTSMQKENLFPDQREVDFHLEIFKPRMVGQSMRQFFAKGGEIPLAIRQLDNPNAQFIWRNSYSAERGPG